MLVTALVTPFSDGGTRPDVERYARLVQAQLELGADAVLVAGTTGEGVLLDEVERDALLDAALGAAAPERLVCSIGGGRLPEVVARGRAALARGVRTLLVADCAYIAPSSAALCEAWYGPIAEALPEARLVPYAVPSRTGTELLPDDLARLVQAHPNVVGVKDATGRLARMERVRELCGEGLQLLCGDDALALDALLDPGIRADGVYSVVANVAPRAVRALVEAGRAARPADARRAHEALQELFAIITITVDERRRVGGRFVNVPARSRNPVPIKAALAMLGLAEQTVRPPLAPLGPAGETRLRETLRRVALGRPELLAPLSRAHGVDLDAALGLARGARSAG